MRYFEKQSVVTPDKAKIAWKHAWHILRSTDRLHKGDIPAVLNKFEDSRHFLNVKKLGISQKDIYHDPAIRQRVRMILDPMYTVRDEIKHKSTEYIPYKKIYEVLTSRKKDAIKL